VSLLEFILAALENVETMAAICFWLVGVVVLITAVMRAVALYDGDKSAVAACDGLLKRLVPIVLISGPICAIPNINHLWKIRIALIKYELASPANIEKGAEVIERIGEKLECKYLGCDEKEQPK
jgi:hypothetical protein